MQAFISYSTTDREIARAIKRILQEFGISAFLAHEDINVSNVWKEQIIAGLRTAKIVVPILSDSFRKSEWGPQEVGFAYREDVLFIPLSVDGTMPFGLISHIQGKRIPPSGPNRESLLHPIVENFPRHIIPHLVKSLGEAGDFRGAEREMLQLMPHFRIFDETEIAMFIDVVIDNYQIWSASECRKNYIPAFLQIHRDRIDRRKLKAIEYQIATGDWYHLKRDGDDEADLGGKGLKTTDRELGFDGDTATGR